MNRPFLLIALAASCLLSLAATPTTASAQEAYLGDIKLTGVGFSQRGWLHCEGQTMSIAENSALFSLLGTTYGGDGRTTFKLPNLKKAEAVLRKAAGVKEDSAFLRYMICTSGVFPSRS